MYNSTIRPLYITLYCSPPQVKSPSINFIFFSKDFIFRAGEGEREGEKHQCVVASRAPPTGDLACNPGMCPDWESNQRPFGLQDGAQSTEPRQPGLNFIFKWLHIMPMFRCTGVGGFCIASIFFYCYKKIQNVSHFISQFSNPSEHLLHNYKPLYFFCELPVCLLLTFIWFVGLFLVDCMSKHYKNNL